jgi:hypothetical protein
VIYSSTFEKIMHALKNKGCDKWSTYVFYQFQPFITLIDEGTGEER